MKHRSKDSERTRTGGPHGGAGQSGMKGVCAHGYSEIGAGLPEAQVRGIRATSLMMAELHASPNFLGTTEDIRAGEAKFTRDADASQTFVRKTIRRDTGGANKRRRS